jgi:hypothetical protein
MSVSVNVFDGSDVLDEFVVSVVVVAPVPVIIKERSIGFCRPSLPRTGWSKNLSYAISIGFDTNEDVKYPKNNNRSEASIS